MCAPVTRKTEKSIYVFSILTDRNSYLDHQFLFLQSTKINFRSSGLQILPKFDTSCYSANHGFVLFSVGGVLKVTCPLPDRFESKPRSSVPVVRLIKSRTTVCATTPSERSAEYLLTLTSFKKQIMILARTGLGSVMHKGKKNTASPSSLFNLDVFTPKRTTTV